MTSISTALERKITLAAMASSCDFAAFDTGRRRLFALASDLIPRNYSHEFPMSLKLNFKIAPIRCIILTISQLQEIRPPNIEFFRNTSAGSLRAYPQI